MCGYDCVLSNDSIHWNESPQFYVTQLTELHTLGIRQMLAGLKQLVCDRTQRHLDLKRQQFVNFMLSSSKLSHSRLEFLSEYKLQFCVQGDRMEKRIYSKCPQKISLMNFLFDSGLHLHFALVEILIYPHAQGFERMHHKVNNLNAGRIKNNKGENNNFRILFLLKESPEEQIPMCTPAKRPKTVADALDLSHKTTMDLPKSSSDVIVLSEDEDEKVTPSSSDTEKENAPCGTNGTDVKSLLISLENDLRQEEATLLLLQKLRESQNSNNSSSSRPVSKATLNSSQSSSSLNNNVSTSNQKPTSSQTSSQRLPSAAQATKSTILFLRLISIQVEIFTCDWAIRSVIRQSRGLPTFNFLTLMDFCVGLVVYSHPLLCIELITECKGTICFLHPMKEVSSVPHQTPNDILVGTIISFDPVTGPVSLIRLPTFHRMSYYLLSINQPALVLAHQWANVMPMSIKSKINCQQTESKTCFFSPKKMKLLAFQKDQLGNTESTFKAKMVILFSKQAPDVIINLVTLSSVTKVSNVVASFYELVVYEIKTRPNPRSV
ncbi:hypothetical protein EGR_07185 [Echinococcus granulosus]|uniref:Transcriptional repressor p66 coiled-coil MBD2-interaction domain-containing protein n=1 Tax=Echinococcus granulosus TaxID=6210 RepID=W6U9F3_ECHGR|nr:hypothetical protein EGR_07185 [Echinococcus granulosus]EUB57993.1 hypothetical protein EGR_07185 [Echinococcus granulosus]